MSADDDIGQCPTGVISVPLSTIERIEVAAVVWPSPCFNRFFFAGWEGHSRDAAAQTKFGCKFRPGYGLQRHAHSQVWLLLCRFLLLALAASNKFIVVRADLVSVTKRCASVLFNVSTSTFFLTRMNTYVYAMLSYCPCWPFFVMCCVVKLFAFSYKIDKPFPPEIDGWNLVTPRHCFLALVHSQFTFTISKF